MRPLTKWCLTLGFVLLIVAVGLGSYGGTHREALFVAPIATVLLIVGIVTYRMDRAGRKDPR